jgi:hypothetical protein
MLLLPNAGARGWFRAAARAGCLAHLRRRIFEAQSAAPAAARTAVNFILDVYRIERAGLDARPEPPA